jgi:hypothetical protein
VTWIDPGWAYYIAGTAGMSVSLSVADSGASHFPSMVIDSTTHPSTPADSVLGYTILGGTSQSFGNAQVPWTRSRTSWTGVHTVNFLFRNGGTGTCAFGPLNAKPEYHFDIQLIPV